MRLLLVFTATSAVAMAMCVTNPGFAGATSPTPQWTVSLHMTTGETLTDISCASVRDCYVIAGAKGEILATHNGGKSWNSVRWQLVGNNLSSIRCGTAWHCETVATPATIWVTTGGGGSWTQHTLHLPKTLARLGRIACPTDQICFVTASPSGRPNTWFNHSSAIYKTADGGTTWQRLSIPKLVGCPDKCTAAHPKWGYDLQWIACVSTRDCRAGGNTFLGKQIGYVSAVIATSNGGATWRLVNHASDPTTAACSTVTVCDGIRYQPGTPHPGPEFMRTASGGKTWNTTIHIRQPLLTSVACSGASFCELAGPHGAVAMATANSFHTQTPATSVDLNAVSCPATTACYAVGAHGTIIAWK